MMRFGIIVASDRGFRGDRADESGPKLIQLINALPGHVVECTLIADEREAITNELIRMADQLECDVILTSGGTGLSPRDVTPDATRDCMDREIPGIAEALRADGRAKTLFAMLSRGVAAIRGRTLIINLPGSPRAVAESFEVLRPVLRHAVELARASVVPVRSGIQLSAISHQPLAKI